MASIQLDSVLIKNTSLSEEQVNLLLSQPSTIGTPIRDWLARKEGGSTDEILTELARQMGLTYIKDIPDSEINSDLVRDIPIGFAKKHGVLPFREDQNSVQVLITNPLKTRVMDDLRVILKKRTVPLMTSKPRIIDAINKVYASAVLRRYKGSTKSTKKSSTSMSQSSIFSTLATTMRRSLNSSTPCSFVRSKKKPAIFTSSPMNAIAR